MMNTNQAVQANDADAPSGSPAKRKRGRPRKYPKLSSEDGSRFPKIQRMRWEEKSSVVGPPGFAAANGNQPRSAAAASSVADSMVGRAVSGVIEAVFDAGYLLNVRVANSDTTLRGVVFKPGHFVPISAENDVAPNVQMIRRTEIPEQYMPRPRERNDPVSKGKQFSPVQNARPESGIQRGNLVPVVLEAGKSSSNGLIDRTQPLKGKQLQEEVVVTHPPPNGSVLTTQVPAFSSDAVFSQPQTIHLLVSDVGSQSENGTRVPVMPFENLVTEVIRRIETPVITHSNESPANNEYVNNKTDQALNIEPLQAVLLSDDNINKLASDPAPMEVDRTNKMSQLLEGPISESPAAKMTETASLVIEHVGKERDTKEEGTTTQESLF